MLIYIVFMAINSVHYLTLDSAHDLVIDLATCSSIIRRYQVCSSGHNRYFDSVF
jgi:hypothetical protein